MQNPSNLALRPPKVAPAEPALEEDLGIDPEVAKRWAVKAGFIEPEDAFPLRRLCRLGEV